MDLMSIVLWLLVGLIAGWLAGMVVRGAGFGIIGNIIVGIIGALIGGFLFGIFFPGSALGFMGSVIVAFIGAVILLALLNLVTGRRASAL
ncbi:MAG: transglycosylase [Dehalococcoidia bacterium]|nr:MAG: transglycosylase [Dehalococcoidia bacterium]